MNQNERVSLWIRSMSSIREYDGSFVNIIYHDEKDSFIQLDERSQYACMTTSLDTLESKILTEDMLVPNEDDYNKECYYFFTTHLQQTVIGKISSDRLIERVISHFIDSFAFVRMDVHVIERTFKSSGDVQVSIVVANSVE